MITQLANNQNVLATDKGHLFVSYGSVIAFKPYNGDTPTVTDKWDYSQTTLKYLKQFLGCSLSKAQLADRIKSGNIILDNSIKNFKVSF
ncbi:hypothetical protein Barba19A_gp058 [Rheinheimera phage vB_RspM_Barba19A]|uniref:DUF8033 domain-containing protein n=2 Tax=Barbavirus barba19A TaxID=2734091 RepID=A0A4P8N7F9_9CAUD|nr:hypothetical protein HOV47_gp058 [Rheinheimera phage vB_RspM_Barba19A]QCQ61898.1 hypothetical protein Barba19A_gp058 [Rheinheimera phage vB_RspM_Barba19A]QCQ64648.1 hypothetical protein Barba31A_gp058 [Rheinheimera phage vB_RspM_Barba31A]